MKLRLLKFFLYLTVSASLSSMMVYPAVAAEASQGLLLTCNVKLADEAKAEFIRLRDLRESDPKAVSITDFKVAATKYVEYAQICYEEKYGTVSDTSINIDEGGVWFDGNSDGLAVAQFVTDGTKWGAGSPFIGGQDVPGPGLPGGGVTYSFMANGVDNTQEGTSSNIAISSLPTYAPCFINEIKDSFDAWSAVANITFTEVVDDGLPFNLGNSGNIRIGAHGFDGPSRVVAHAFFPPPNGNTAAGDIHFDQDELWACVDSGLNIDIGIVALHEIGHAIGLSHEISPPTAIMNPTYNAAVDILQPDDITGIESIYGDIVLPTCDMNTAQLSYSSGEMVNISRFFISNLTPSSIAVEMKVWLTFPALDSLELVNEGADGLLVFPVNTETDLAKPLPLPLSLLDATGAPLGTYTLGCRLLNPVTGALLYEDLHRFEVIL